MFVTVYSSCRVVCDWVETVAAWCLSVARVFFGCVGLRRISTVYQTVCSRLVPVRCEEPPRLRAEVSLNDDDEAEDATPVFRLPASSLAPARTPDDNHRAQHHRSSMQHHLNTANQRAPIDAQRAAKPNTRRNTP